MRADDLRDLLAHHRPFHSAYQMDHFITAAAGGTPWGMFQQALRELRTRFDALKIDYAAREELVLALEGDDDEHGVDPSDGIADRKRRLLQGRKRMQLDTLDALIRDREREFAHFYAQAVALRDLLGPLTAERTAELEEDLWIHRAKCLAAEDYVARGQLGPHTLTALRALPPTTRATVLAAVTGDPRHLTDWWVNYDPGLPAIEAPPADEIRRLLCP